MLGFFHFLSAQNESITSQTCTANKLSYHKNIRADAMVNESGYWFRTLLLLTKSSSYKAYIGMDFLYILCIVFCMGK